MHIKLEVRKAMAWAWPGWGWRGRGWWGPWPGRGPFSYLPPWLRPGWLFGRGACWWLFGYPWAYGWGFPYASWWAYRPPLPYLYWW
ncbi:MAG: hypothetical protein DRO52_05440 [Candidatus Hecatellales archaeon]|nr:MAG: hypothetical protein DRO52_05440 [Candidatus Hecatellales archaeon]